MSRRPRSDAPVWFVLGFWLFIVSVNVAWLGFIVWAIYSLVTWLTSK